MDDLVQSSPLFSDGGVNHIDYDMQLLDINRTNINPIDMATDTLDKSVPGGNFSSEEWCDLVLSNNMSGLLNGTSLSDCVTEETYLLPWYHQLFWYFLYGSMVIIAAGGNLIVIYIVLADSKMRSVTNIFLVNLSIADAMNATFNVIFNFTYMLNNLDWPFGSVYCKISEFVSVLSISASVFTLMAISFDR